MYHGRFMGTHYEADYKWGKLLLGHGKTLEHCPTFTPDDEMREFAQLCKAEYKKYYPELLDEIQGIADGQRLPVETLESILFPMYSMRFENHCTCFAFSSADEIVFARNSDFLVSIENCI